MTEREEFEAWGKLNNFSIERQPADEKFADYMSLTTERAWQAWQAARHNIPLLVCSETIRKAVLRTDPWAIGLAQGLASLANNVIAETKEQK